MSVKTTIKAQLNKYPGLVKTKRELWHKYFDFTRLNLPEAFPLFKPNSAGFYHDQAWLTIQTINQIFPALSAFVASVGLRQISVENIESISVTGEELQAVANLKKVLDAYGSDKANFHNYHNLYATILSNREAIQGFLEIGLGTNNLKVVSNMGALGKPGASLRAFRDFLPNANIYGADIDKEILFTEDRIQTVFVDQTDSAAFAALDKLVPSELDLIIDDGLHSPNANIITMTFALPKIRVGGWFVIEDIALEALPAWEVTAALLPDSYEVHIYKAVSTLVFAVRRLS